MRVLSVNAGQDLAGTGIRLKRAFDRHSDWQFDSIARSETYLSYPTDRPWTDAQRLWDQADVVHLHNNFRTAALLEHRRKPAVLHHHGTFFRENHRGLLAESRRRGAIGIAATLDLHLMAPELEWVPAAYDTEWLASLRRPIDDGIIRIATAPTDRTIKSTEALIRAVHRLARRYPVRLVLIERQPWVECLAQKATADIYFDQVKLGYGCNAVEAMGMGIPVVAGADPATIGEYRRRFGDLPFQRATEAMIRDALVELIESPDLRSSLGLRGQEHVRRWHSEASVVSQLERIYEAARSAS